MSSANLARNWPVMMIVAAMAGLLAMTAVARRSASGLSTPSIEVRQAATAPARAAQATQPSPSSSILPRVLIFAKTAGYRHDSIPDGIAAIWKLGDANNFEVDATKDADAFTDANLRKYRAVVFLSTTGDVLNDAQQKAMEHFIHAGGGFVGIHAATDTEYDWPWYTQLVAAQFAAHPKIQPATVNVTDRDHVSTRHLPEKWTRTDEWYNFRDSPTEKAGGRLRILMMLDETTYEGGTMRNNHPVCWCQEFDGGRAWYTELGHTRESYSEESYLRHILGGIQWAMGVKE